MRDSAAEAFFSAGVGLALLDQVLSGAPPFAGALRRRLALRAASASAMILRLREEEGALRDAAHFATPSADPGPAGRLHRLWRGLAAKTTRFDNDGLRAAADMLASPLAIDVETLAPALRNLARETCNPLSAATQAASSVASAMPDAPRAEAEILALWAADLVLAERLSWSAPVPLAAAKILDPMLRRGPKGKRPRPNDPDWPETVARAYALAACDAHALAADLARRSEKLLAVAPKLRAKGARRVVELLLDDDSVTPARVMTAAGLSDRASRRLFDRLVELGAVRELSGRPNFRLYGL